MLNRSHVPVLPGRFPAKYNEFPKVWRELATEMLQVADIYLQELTESYGQREAGVKTREMKQNDATWHVDSRQKMCRCIW